MSRSRSPSTTKFSFNAKAVRYSPLNAYWLACCAAAAYEDQGAVERRIVGGWGFDKITFIARGATQCFVTGTDEIVVLAFRGTEPDEMKDLLTDLNAIQVQAYGGRVHTGFRKAYNLVRAQVASAVKKHRTRNQALFVTGHSLGAALATLAAADLHEQHGIRGVYTFGQPRVGDRAFCAHYNALLKGRHFRIAAVDDPVTHIPPSTAVLGRRKISYDHVKRVIHLASRNRLVLKYQRSKDVLSSIEAAVEGPPSHLMKKYLAAMKQNIDKDPFSTPDKVIKEPSRTRTVARKVAHKVDEAVSAAGKAIGRIGKLF